MKMFNVEISAIKGDLQRGQKSYLTHVILPGLSREGYILVVLELTRHSRQVTSLLF